MYFQSVALKLGNKYTELTEPSKDTYVSLLKNDSTPVLKTTGKEHVVTFCHEHFVDKKKKKTTGHWSPVSYMDIIWYHSHDLKRKTNPEEGFLLFFFP